MSPTVSCYSWGPSSTLLTKWLLLWPPWFWAKSEWGLTLRLLWEGCSPILMDRRFSFLPPPWEGCLGPFVYDFFCFTFLSLTSLYCCWFSCPSSSKTKLLIRCGFLIICNEVSGGDMLPSPYWCRIFYGTLLVEMIGEGWPPVLLPLAELRALLVAGYLWWNYILLYSVLPIIWLLFLTCYFFCCYLMRAWSPTKVIFMLASLLMLLSTWTWALLKAWEGFSMPL